MGQLTKDEIRVIGGKVFFIPSGSQTIGVSQSFDSVAQHYTVTMSGTSLSQSVLAPANETASFWYFRTPDAYSFKVFYQNANRTSIEPTGSIFGLRDLPNSRKTTVTGSSIPVFLPMGCSGSIIMDRTTTAIRKFRAGTNRYTISGSQRTYIHLHNIITGAPVADDINFNYISGSSISYHVQISGSGRLRGRAGTGIPNTGSATVQMRLNEVNKESLETALPDSRSFMNVRDGFYGISVTKSTTGSNISMHGGIPSNIGLPLPNSPYIKTNGGFAILMDNAGSPSDSSFPNLQVFKHTGVPGFGGTELLTLDHDGNLSVAGTISNASGSVDGGSF